MASIYPISETTIGAGGNQIMEWTSIPSTYTDLLLTISVRSSYAASYVSHRFRVNNDTGGNYNEKWLYGDGSSLYSYSQSGTTFITLGLNGSTSTSNSFTPINIYIPNYAGNKIKAFNFNYSTETNGTTSYPIMQSARWNSTDAISSLKIDMATGNTAVQYSSGTLYGIK